MVRPDRGGGNTNVCDHTNVCAEARGKASGSVLGISEVFEATGIKTLLKMLEVQGQLQDRFIGGAVDWWECALSLL